MIQCECCQRGVREVYENQVYYNCPYLQLECIQEWDGCPYYKPLLKEYSLKPLINTLEEKDKTPTL